MSGSGLLMAPVDGGETSAPRRRRHTRRALKVFGALVLAACAVVAVFALKLSQGVPESWTEKIGSALSTDEIAVEPSGVSFSIPRMTLRIAGLKLFHKGEICKPFVDAESVQVHFKPRLAAAPETWVSSVSVESLVLDIETTGSGEGGPLDALADVEFPEIPPIRLFCSAVDVLGLKPRGVSAEVSCSKKAISVKVSEISFPEEKAAHQKIGGSVTIYAGEPAIEVKSDGRLDPNVAVPVLTLVGEEDIAEEIAKFSFAGDAPWLGVSYRYCPGRDERKLVFDVESGPASYNGVPLDGFSGLLCVGAPERWSRLEVPRLRIVRPEGRADARLELLPRQDTLIFSGSSSMDPMALFAMIGIVSYGSGQKVAFPSGAELRFGGTLGLGPTVPSDISASMFAETVLVGGAAVTDAAANIFLQGDELRVPDFHAKVFEGDLLFEFATNLGRMEGSPTNMPVKTSLKIDKASNAAVSKFRHPQSDAVGGILDASLSLEGPLGDIVEKTFVETTGDFSLDVRQSKIFRIPVFAGLTDLLARYIPGVDWLVDSDNLAVKGVFGDGKFRMEKFSIDGAVVSLSGKGFIYFPECELDLKVKGSLLNRSTWLGEGVYWLLSPISKMLEIRATGTASDPKWSSATFQSNPSSRK